MVDIYELKSGKNPPKAEGLVSLQIETLQNILGDASFCVILRDPLLTQIQFCEQKKEELKYLGMLQEKKQMAKPCIR